MKIIPSIEIWHKTIKNGGMRSQWVNCKLYEQVRK